MNLPTAFGEPFAERYAKLTDWEAFKQQLSLPPRRSIRVNTLKTTIPALLDALTGWNLEQIPWCREGFWVSPPEGLGSTSQHTRGLFYIQEAASMIPVLVLAPRPGEKVLDMCASPGGKTSQIAQYMENKGTLIASDIREDRIAILRRNLDRMGVKNCTVLQQPGQQFRDMAFDRILVDAPCSGTGNLCGNPEELANWNPAIFKRLSDEQKSLLHHAYCVLKKGGLLVYSTCSLEPEEDEAVVDWLLKRHKKTELEKIDLPLKRSAPILEFGGEKYDPRVDNCLRLWPQDNGTAGFFVARIRKLDRRRAG